MNRPQQSNAVTGAENAGDPQNFTGTGLYRPIPDRALVEFGNAGSTMPAKCRAHDAGLQRMLHEIIAPGPVLRELLAMLREHDVRFECRHAEAPSQSVCR